MDTLQEPHFGINSFEVLFVTLGRKRIANMIEQNKKFRNKRGWKRFLFTAQEEIKD